MFDKPRLRFIHVYINSNLAKFKKLDILHNVQIPIIRLSECEPDNSVHDNEICVPGYDILRKGWNRNGGGAFAYIKNDLA